MKKRTKNLIGVILTLVGVSILSYLLWGSVESFVPENFSGSRGKSAVIASEIVSELDLSLKNLNKISEEDRSGRFSSALNLVEQETEKIEKAKADAIQLSNELINMAQAVQGIRPTTARNLALEAVTQETTLIGHLINYNAYFSGLLATLKLKFADDIKYNSNDVQNYISKMNGEREEINSINDSFNQKLKEFDNAIN
jgi:hypothetical protein